MSDQIAFFENETEFNMKYIISLDINKQSNLIARMNKIIY